MYTKIVSSKDLTSLSLRASDYAASPKYKAEKLLTNWMKANPGFMHPSTPAMKDLKKRIADAIREALEEGLEQIDAAT